jgi:type VI protein secretion system component VasK
MNSKTTILLLGAKGVGKQTLLKHTQINLESFKHSTYDCWSNKETQFIIANKELNSESCTNLFQALKKNNSLQPIQSIAILIDTPSLADPDELLLIAKQLGNQLHIIKQELKNFDLNLIVSKCDLLLGFKEYFGNLSTEERQRIFGVDTKHDFTTLLKQLNTQTIPRMHQESLVEKRGVIQIFPTQFEKFIELVHQFTTAISAESGLQTQNIYFTSSTQKGNPIDLLGRYRSELTPPISDKPYFIAEMVTGLCTNATNNKFKAKRFDKKRWIALPACLIIIIALVTTWHSSYKHTSHALKQIEAQLQQKPTNQKKPTWLMQLRLLSDSIDKLNAPSLKYSRIIGFGQTTKLKKKLTLLYNTELQTRFLPYIEGILSDAMVHGMHHDKLMLYNSLKIYLMLTKQSHYDQKTIVNWFSQYWGQKYKKNPDQQQFLSQQLQNLLTLKNKDWPRNQPLIDQAQQTLQQLPAADIIFLELQGEYKNQNVPLASMLQNHDNLDLSKASVPALFNPSNFKQIYNQQIPSLVSTFSQGNWVIGQANTSDNTQNSQSVLISDVRALYLQYLSQAWQGVIPEIQLIKPTSFADIQSLINEMSNPQSSLMELLEFASGNANLNKQLQPNKNLQQVTQFLEHKAAYTKANSALQGLSNYLKAIVSSNDINKSSYNTTVSILNNPKQINPISTLYNLKLNSPIQSWLNTIARGSWTILLQNSRSYLNTVWDNTVLPSYSSQIEGRYPFNDKSDDNVSINNFNGFLGPDGTIDVFFSYYMKPFVNMQSNYWTWQKVYGQHIQIPRTVLDMFIRASLIQQMFYTDNHTKPSFKFSLTPITMSQNISAVTINIEGQIQQYTSVNHSASIMMWPGPNSGNASINTTYTNSKATTQSFSGPWALFRLVQSGTLTPMNDPQKYLLLLKLGTGSATYHIITDNRINPFIPNVLTKFTCPETL